MKIINSQFTKILTLVAYLSMVFVNYLAVTLPLAGRDTGAISDSYPNLFAPVGYTFSIWGLIYLLLGLYVFYQFRQNKDSLTPRLNKIFIVNAFLNAAWIFAWHYDYIWLSVLIMLGLLFTLIKIADILRVSTLSKQQRWFVRLPFSVYFGWITVATIANITVFLVKLNWGGFGLAESLWMIIILLVGTAIGSARILYDKNIPYGLVLIWAYGGILSKHISSTGYASQYPSVINTTVLAMVVFTAAIILTFSNIKQPK